MKIRILHTGYYNKGNKVFLMRKGEVHEVRSIDTIGKTYQTMTFEDVEIENAEVID